MAASRVFCLYVVVSIKWGKEKFDGIEIDTNEATEVFKAQLMALTGVEPDRQKVMLKGSTLKESWDTFKGLKNVSDTGYESGFSEI